MILIIGRFQVKVERLAAFQAYAREVVAEERHVEGCVGFDILQDVTQADQFVMLERWRDQAALERHLQSAAYARNEATMSGFFADEATWAEYEV